MKDVISCVRDCAKGVIGGLTDCLKSFTGFVRDI